jgi:tetratricopeptide (TPR) repeat protein
MILKDEEINVLLKKGKKFHYSDKYVPALNNYKKVLKIDTKNVDGLLGEGKALLELGENKKAKASLNKALKIEPSNSEALHYNGHVLEELEDFVNAIIYYEKAYEISKDQRIPSHIGFCYYNIDKWKYAISWFDKGLE